MRHFKNPCTQFLTMPSMIFACIFSSFSQAATVSDLLITEVMANPAAVSDTNGEWFELFNPTNESIDLNGITLSDDGGNRHVITSDSALLVNPGSFFVMARNGDDTTNGGFSADYVYNSFSLGNTRDQIIFSDANSILLRLDYEAGFVPAAGSTELINGVMQISNYRASETAFGLGDLGTPGSAGAFDIASAPSPVPLPGAVWLMASGLLGFIGFKRKQQHAS
ncbi:hypothetical protein MNBD_GAMMA07-1822 [hydrothermal vent metagenome]|uniref:LTD domain-containing protein n=1 Tax=hydrothermal vent metagenome TaxID=652676 RepID=A0A3B0WN65_9ZZZZ